MLAQNQPTGFMAQDPSMQRSAVLYLFSPRRVFDHFKRPLMYNFTPDYTEKLYDTIADSLSTQHNPKASIDGFIQSPAAQTSILPAANSGSNLATSVYGEHWTFFLVVNNDLPNGPYHSANVMNKYLYSGICFDEPINPVDYGNGTVINPGCQLIVTHKTMIGMTPIIGGIYQTGSRVDTLGDVDIVPGNSMSSLNPAMMFNNRPGDIRNMTIQDHGAIMTTPSDHDALANQTVHVPMTSKLASPQHYNKLIVNSIVDGFETMSANVHLGGYGDPAMPGEPTLNNNTNDYRVYNVNESIIPHIDANMQDKAYDGTGAGLNTDEPIALGLIMDMYYPEIVRFDPQSQDQLNVRPQHYTSPHNIFSSLIASVTPSMMANVGLVDFAFEYESYRDVFNIHLANGYTPLSEGEAMAKVRALQYLLRHNLFNVIRAAVGTEFQVFVSATVTGDTDITLNLYDYSSQAASDEVYKHHNFLGGIGNQLVAEYPVIEHNSVSLGGVINAISANV